MNSIKVSILIPIYNGVEFFKQCIESVKLQDFQDFQIIIGVNGHPPISDTYKSVFNQTRETFIDNAKKIDILILDLHWIAGKSNALNRMIKHATHDWISLLDVDDFWMPTKLSQQIKYTENYDVIGTNCRYFGDITGAPKLPMGDLEHFNFFDYNPIINSSCLIKKELAVWDSTIDGVEDYDLWLKLKKQNKKFFNVQNAFTMHRIHNSSAFNSKGNYLMVNDIKQRYI